VARRVFFSFHHDRDVFRVGQIRNAWVVTGEAAPLLDHAAWETVKRQGDAAIKNWIDNQLHGASVTCVLIGAETANRPWVQYEIRKSLQDGKGLLGVTVHNMKSIDQKTDYAGANPFSLVKLTDGTLLSQHVSIYDWVQHDGRNNIGSWIEAAAKQFGR